MLGNHSWGQNLRKFADDGVLGRFLKSRYLLIESAIRGRKPDRVVDEEKWQRQFYDETLHSKFEDWPIALEKVDVAVSTPEYLANRLKLNVDDVKENWGNVKEKKRYGGNACVYIGKIDDESNLIICDSQFPDAIYGTFLEIRKTNRTIWPGAKFDYKNKGDWAVDVGDPKLNDPNYHNCIDEPPFNADDIYKYVNGLIQISKECDCGISTKFVRADKRGGLLLTNFLHIYPYFASNASSSSESLQMQQMERVYRKGKELWGDNFRINPFSRGDRDMRQYLDTIEKF